MSMVRTVIGGVDTHADFHVAAAIDGNGAMLGIESFPTDAAGYEELLGWLVGFGAVTLVGVEGTGSWGVGLARFLHDQEVETVGWPGVAARKRRLLAPAQDEGVRLDPAVDLELVEDVLDVVANGRRRQEQLVGDGGPVEALGEEV